MEDKGMSRRRMLRVAAVGLLSAGLVSRTTQAVAAGTIESHYAVRGPWAVTASDAGDASGTYRLHHPADLGAGGFRHPIVTWGNGSHATPALYPGVLDQLASWGFAVIASTDTTTGTGTEMLAAAQYLVARNADPASPFHQRLDATRVGAAGHSQGAGGTVNAANLSAGLVTTAVPIALPAQLWVGAGDRFQVSQLACPVLFLSGSNDWLISPASALRGYYDQVPGAAAMALLKGAGHNDIQGTGGGFLGYLTAWLMYRLQDDDYARGAFAGSAPEFTANTAWQNQAAKNLP
ncbi:alpha/beta hydrolase [Streptosporangium sp. NPDC049248]|uniref:alpha/beta hydrolase family protein n=1 Tax=Streptosporangium sp. NPDC049248 TaxID=3155651 RepID=UPI00341C201D